MRVVLKRVGCEPEVVEIDGSLDSMQGIVDGYIEVFPLDETGCCIICNEEGRVRNLATNFIIEVGYAHAEEIYGDVFFCRCGVEDFESVTDNDIAGIMNMFAEGMEI